LENRGSYVYLLERLVKFFGLIALAWRNLQLARSNYVVRTYHVVCEFVICAS